MPGESRQRRTLFAVMCLGPQATVDTELPPEFLGVDGLMQYLNLCLFYWERIHEKKSWITDLLSAFLQVCGQLRTWQRRKEWWMVVGDQLPNRTVSLGKRKGAGWKHSGIFSHYVHFPWEVPLPLNAEDARSREEEDLLRMVPIKHNGLQGSLLSKSFKELINRCWEVPARQWIDSAVTSFLMLFPQAICHWQW